jgi:phosphotransferase system enzyme I (PtsI)
LRTEALLYSGIAHKREADQIRFYQQILSKSKGEVTIRLFDVGGDKLNISAKNEDNPFLGWRGIRMLLDERELLQSQIRAILKVSSKYRGRIKILVPMVTVVEEIVEVKEVFKEVEAELIKASVDFDSDVKIGIMVEVPSVALLANHFAQQVDFISIGTNDLTQYTLAVDRGNERICTLYQQYHPAILHLVKLAATAAQNHGIVCEVCGELAGDPIGTAFLLGIGINNLSMSPTHIPRIKHFLSTNFHKDFTSFAQQSLQATSAAEVREHFEALF